MTRAHAPDSSNARSIGTVISVPDPALAESVGRSFDFVWIDLEHGALGLRDVQTIAIATQSAGCTTYVRLPRWDSDCLPAVLDAGVDGIVAPMIEHRDQAMAVVARLHFPPAGSRGFGPRRAGGYGRMPDFWTSPGANVACVLQIETPLAVDSIADIVAVEGIDAVVIGSSDLSLALGVPQDLGSAAMRSAIDKVEAAAAAAGIRCGLAAGGAADTIADVISERTNDVVYSVDIRLYTSALDDAAARLRYAAGRGGGTQ